MAVTLDRKTTTTLAQHEAGTHKTITTDAAPSVAESESPRQAFESAWSGLRTTAPWVAKAERGDDQASNLSGVIFKLAGRRSKGLPYVPNEGEAVRRRSELVREIRSGVSTMMSTVGTFEFATHINMLKRDLSRCHDTIAEFPSEGNFLSIVTMIEAAITQHKWTDLTREQLLVLIDALDVGYRKPRVSFADYDSARQKLNNAGFDTHPRLDFDSITMDELDDGEEDPGEEAPE